MDASGRSAAKRGTWWRTALVIAGVGVVLALGKAIPVAGLDLGLVTELHRYCSGSSGHWHGMWLISCPTPHLAHKELGGTALLGVVALAVFAILFIRSALAPALTRR